VDAEIIPLKEALVY